MIGCKQQRFRRHSGRLAASVALGLLLSACVSPYAHPGPRAQLGAVTGAVAGGLLGAAAGGGGAEAIVAGVLLGGLLGGAVGDTLDHDDRRYLARNFQSGLEYEPSGHTSYWRNPDSGRSGSVTPVLSWDGGYGPCREFKQTVTMDGGLRRVRGTACRDADGFWRVDR
ncbi:MAG: RT0821/Lpp0805 family surface protein [Myxococcota bacterium]